MNKTISLKCVLCILLAMLLVTHSGRALAYPNVHLGLGLSRDCQSVNGEHTNCFSAARGEFLLDIFGKSQTEIKTPFGRETAGKSDTCYWCYILAAPELVVFTLAIAVGVLLVAGIVWVLAAIFSSELSVGIFYGQDALITDSQQEELENVTQYIERKRYGVQLGFYPVTGWWWRIHLGTGPAASQLRMVGENRIEDYRDARATKAGIGIVPPIDKSGPFIFYENEYLTIYNRTWRDAINYRGDHRAEYRLGTAVMSGYAVSF